MSSYHKVLVGEGEGVTSGERVTVRPRAIHTVDIFTVDLYLHQQPCVKVGASHLPACFGQQAPLINEYLVL